MREHAFHQYDEEHADMSQRPSQVGESFLRKFIWFETPPKGVSIAVLRAWHEARLEALEAMATRTE